MHAHRDDVRLFPLIWEGAGRGGGPEPYFIDYLTEKVAPLGHSVSSGLVAMQTPSLIWLILLHLAYFHRNTVLTKSMFPPRNRQNTFFLSM